jgi:hypothetical protein
MAGCNPDKLDALGCLIIVGALVSMLCGCVHGPREELLESRRAFVSPRDGDGSLRLATWPMSRDTFARLGETGR